MKIKIAIFFTLISFLSLNAQDAKSILDNANQSYNKAGGLIVKFTLNAEDTKSKITYSQDGTTQLKGNKFKIEVPDGITWFDGKTQWTYAKGSDEVNVSNPTGDELAGISPFVLLNIYKKGFKLVYNGESVDKGKSIYSVDLIPETSKTDFKKINVNIDKSNWMFNSIKIYNKDGMVNHLIINKLQAGVNLSDDIFLFDKKNYPNVEIVDLR